MRTRNTPCVRTATANSASSSWTWIVPSPGSPCKAVPVTTLLRYSSETRWYKLEGGFLNTKYLPRLEASTKEQTMRTSRTPAVLVLVLTMGAQAQGQKLPSDDSTFMVAVTRGDVALVKKMLDEKRGDVNGTNGARYTWLHLAANHGHKAMIELLIARGADAHKHGDCKNAARYAPAMMGLTSA